MRLYEVITPTYSEVEFVCHNERYPNSTQLDSQQALEQDLRQMEGVVVLRQDWSTEHDGRQISLSAIVLDRNLLQQVKNAAMRYGVEIDMINKVDNEYVDRAIRGGHDGQMVESRLGNAAFAGIAAASLAGAINTSANIQRQADLDSAPTPNIDHLINRPAQPDTSLPDLDIQDWWDKQNEEEPEEESYQVDEWAKNIASTYRINHDFAKRVVELAVKYEDEVFPKATDILAVMAVESSFNPRAVSRLRKDPARGLMQVRPGVWKLDPQDLNSVENQVRIGARILNKYYKRAGDAAGAIQAYNIGITNYRLGKENPAYLAKVMREKESLFSF